MACTRHRERLDPRWGSMKMMPSLGFSLEMPVLVLTCCFAVDLSQSKAFFEKTFPAKINQPTLRWDFFRSAAFSQFLTILRFFGIFTILGKSVIFMKNGISNLRLVTTEIQHFWHIYRRLILASFPSYFHNYWAGWWPTNLEILGQR